jgi:hypothetical protein
MGRDKPKKYGKMNSQQKEIYLKNELEKRGETAVYHGDFQGRGGTGGFNYDATREKFESLNLNSYDYRRSVESGQLDKDLRGDGSARDYVNYQRAATKFHKNEQGNSGKWDSNKDITGTTQALVQDQERARAEDFKKMYMNDMNSMRDELEADQGVQEQSETNPQSFEHSDAVSKAKDNLDKYQLDVGEGNLFANSNEPAPRADDQKDATQAFTDQYKFDVKDASNLGETKARNLNNAASVVASYRQ